MTIPAPQTTASMGLFLVFKGSSNFRLNFIEFNGKGLSPDTRPTVKITSPAENAAVQPGQVTFTADATDAENTITKVEFFVDGAKIGEDTAAPYSVDWTQTTEKFYAVHAVATNSKGLTGDSRKVRFSVGEAGIRPPWETFANVDAELRQGRRRVHDQRRGRRPVAGRQRLRHGLPAGRRGRRTSSPRSRSPSFDATHSNAKAGIMVRNEIPQGGGNDNLGYLVFAEKGNGEAEYMHDAGGNGQVNNAGEPVGDRLRHGQPADVAEGREVRQEVLGLLLAQRHRVDPGRPTTTIPRRRPSRTSACSSSRTSRARRPRPSSPTGRSTPIRSPGGPVDARADVPADGLRTSSTAR